MNIKHRLSILAGLIIILFASSVFNTVPVVYAQSLQNWSDPINLSNSGSSTDPVMVIDSIGAIHLVWVDAIDGYEYVESTDGKVWTSPQNANFPFSSKNDSIPTFFANSNGVIYILWRNKEHTLYYGQTQSEYLGNSSSWSRVSKIINSVVDYHAVVDSQLRSSGWSKTLNIYSSLTDGM